MTRNGAKTDFLGTFALIWQVSGFVPRKKISPKFAKMHVPSCYEIKRQETEKNRQETV